MFIMMDTKQFIGKYLKDCSPEEFLRRQYITVSVNVRTTNNFPKYSFDGKGLYPHGDSALGYFQDRTKERLREYKNNYYRQLLDSGVLIGSIIEVGYSQDEIRDVVFLANQNDIKKGYFDLLMKFFEKRYGVRCVWYSDYRRNKYTELSPKERKDVVNRARIAIYESQKREFISKLNTSMNARKDFHKIISMDDKIRILKELGKYEKGMHKSDINDEIKDFLNVK